MLQMYKKQCMQPQFDWVCCIAVAGEPGFTFWKKAIWAAGPPNAAHLPKLSVPAISENRIRRILRRGIHSCYILDPSPYSRLLAGNHSSDAMQLLLLCWVLEDLKSHALSLCDTSPKLCPHDFKECSALGIYQRLTPATRIAGVWPCKSPPPLRL